MAIQKQKAKAVQMIKTEAGKVGWAILWLLGVPLPVLLIIYFLRGCS